MAEACTVQMGRMKERLSMSMTVQSCCSFPLIETSPPEERAVDHTDTSLVEVLLKFPLSVLRFSIGSGSGCAVLVLDVDATIPALASGPAPDSDSADASLTVEWFPAVVMCR